MVGFVGSALSPLINFKAWQNQQILQQDELLHLFSNQAFYQLIIIIIIMEELVVEKGFFSFS